MANVYYSAAWADMEEGTIIMTPGGTAMIGIDAFGDYAAAQCAGDVVLCDKYYNAEWADKSNGEMVYVVLDGETVSLTIGTEAFSTLADAKTAAKSANTTLAMVGGTYTLSGRNQWKGIANTIMTNSCITGSANGGLVTMLDGGGTFTDYEAAFTVGENAYLSSLGSIGNDAGCVVKEITYNVNDGGRVGTLFLVGYCGVYNGDLSINMDGGTINNVYTALTNGTVNGTVNVSMKDAKIGSFYLAPQYSSTSVLADGASINFTLDNSTLYIRDWDKNHTLVKGAGSSVNVAVEGTATSTINFYSSNVDTVTIDVGATLAIDSNWLYTGTITIDASTCDYSQAQYLLVSGSGITNAITVINDDPTKNYSIVKSGNNVYYQAAKVYFSAAWGDLADGTIVTTPGGTAMIGVDAFGNYATAKAMGDVVLCDSYYSSEWADKSDGETVYVVLDGETVSLTIGTNAYTTLADAQSGVNDATAVVIEGGSYACTFSGTNALNGKRTVLQGGTFTGSLLSGAASSSVATVDVTANDAYIGSLYLGRYTAVTATADIRISGSSVGTLYTTSGGTDTSITTILVENSRIGTMSGATGNNSNVINVTVTGSTVTGSVGGAGCQNSSHVMGDVNFTFADSYVTQFSAARGTDGGSWKESRVKGDVTVTVNAGTSNFNYFDVRLYASNSMTVTIDADATLTTTDFLADANQTITIDVDNFQFADGEAVHTVVSAANGGLTGYNFVTTGTALDDYEFSVTDTTVSLVKKSVYFSAAWVDLADGTIVTTPNGTATIGTDAFATFADAIEAGKNADSILSMDANYSTVWAAGDTVTLATAEDASLTAVVSAGSIYNSGISNAYSAKADAIANKNAYAIAHSYNATTGQGTATYTTYDGINRNGMVYENATLGDVTVGIGDIYVINSTFSTRMRGYGSGAITNGEVMNYRLDNSYVKTYTNLGANYSTSLSIDFNGGSLTGNNGWWDFDTNLVLVNGSTIANLNPYGRGGNVAAGFLDVHGSFNLTVDASYVGTIECQDDWGTTDFLWDEGFNVIIQNGGTVAKLGFSNRGANNITLIGGTACNISFVTDCAARKTMYGYVREAVSSGAVTWTVSGSSTSSVVGALNVRAADATYSGRISSDALTVSDDSTFFVTGSVNNAGAITVDVGSLFVADGALTTTGSFTIDATDYALGEGVSFIKVVDAQNALDVNDFTLVGGSNGLGLFAQDGDIYYGKASVQYSAAWVDLETGTVVTTPGGTATIGDDAFGNYATAKAMGNVVLCDKYYNAEWADKSDGETVYVVLDGETVSLTIGTEAFSTLAAAKTAAKSANTTLAIVGGTTTMNYRNGWNNITNTVMTNATITGSANGAIVTMLNGGGTYTDYDATFTVSKNSSLYSLGATGNDDPKVTTVNSITYNVFDGGVITDTIYFIGFGATLVGDVNINVADGSYVKRIDPSYTTGTMDGDVNIAVSGGTVGTLKLASRYSGTSTITDNHDINITLENALISTLDGGDATHLMSKGEGSTFNITVTGNTTSTVSNWGCSTIDTLTIDATATLVNTTNFSNYKNTITVDAANCDYTQESYLILSAGSEITNAITVINDDPTKNYAIVKSGNNVYYQAAPSDVTAPTIAIIPSTTAWTNLDVTIYATCSDDLSGIATQQYKINGGDWQNYTDDGIVVASAGTVYFKATDNAGNVATTSYTVSNIDKDIPTISGIAPSTTSWTNQSVTLYATCSDDLSGIATQQYKINGDNWQTYTGDGVVVASAGTVFLKATDNAGNVATASYEITNIDKIAPTISNITPSTTSWTNGHVSVSADFADVLSGIAAKMYSFNQVNWFDYTEAVDVAENTTVTFKAVDVAGNVTTDFYVVTNIDTDAPTISGITPSTTGWTNQDVTVTANFTDAKSGIATKQYSFDETDWFDYTDGVVASGNQTIYFKATDVAGNVATTSYTVTNIDTVPPTITTNISCTRWVNAETGATLTIDYDDDLSSVATVEYRIGTGSWVCYTGGISLGGNCSVSFRATDHAGNTRVTNYEVTNFDNLKPVVSDITPNTLEWTNQDITVTATFTDDLSGVATCDYKIGKEGEWIHYSGAITVTENTTIYFRASDNAGNQIGYDDSQYCVIANIDKELPTIENVVPATTEWTRQGVTITPTLSDTLSGIQSTQYSTDGTSWKNFSGQFTVSSNCTAYVRATDRAGNTTTTSYTVTNIDTDAPMVAIFPSTTDWTNLDVTIYATCSDDLSGIATQQYKINGGDWQSYPDDGIVVANAGTVYFKATDNAGNVATTSYTVSNIDKIAPTISNIQLQDDVVTANFADDLSGIATKQYKINGGDWQSYTADGIVVANAGTVYFKATDVAGNTATTSYEVTNVFDARIVVGGTSTEPNPYTLTEGKTYTAAPYDGNGGAVYVAAGGTVTGNNVSFAGNTATHRSGGAIYNKGTITLDSATFADNTAGGNGGAIYNTGVITVDSATFTGNMAGENGGAIYNKGTINFSGTIELATASDTWLNAGSTSQVNWDLTGGTAAYGTIKNFERYSNSNEFVKQTITVSATQETGDYVIATGDLYDLTNKDTFILTGVTGLDDVSITVGDSVNYGDLNYSLANVDNAQLVLTVEENVEPQKFSIEISVKDGTGTKMYDGTMLLADGVTSKGLLPGDILNYKIHNNSLTNVGTVTTSTDVTMYRFIDEKLVDVTNLYEISKSEATLTITARDVTMRSVDATKEYDGTALTASMVNESGSGFVEGEGATYSNFASQTNVGTCENSFSYTLNEGTDLNNYTITTIDGTLTVTTPAPITITADSATKTYDGIALTAGYTYTQGILADGEQLFVTMTGSITDAGTTANQVTSYKVMRGDVDVTGNYVINLGVDGTLKVTMRDVTMRSVDATKEYDGTALTASMVNESGSGFVEGEGATYSDFASQTNVGTCENSFSYTLNEGTDLNNYAITQNYGTLEVTQRQTNIEITVNHLTKSYDGTDEIVLEASDWSFTKDKDLVANEELTLTVTAKSVDAGEYAAGNDVTYEYHILNAQQVDVTDCYTFKTTPVVTNGLTIERATLSITLNTGLQRLYDGTKNVTIGSGDYTITGLQNNEEIDTITFAISSKDAGTYSVTVESFTLKNGAKVANYIDASQIVVDGIYTINQRSVTLTSSTDEKKYDGTALEGTVTVTGDGFVEGEATVAASSLLHAGTVTDTINITGGTGYVAANYNITKDEGTLTVTQRELTLTSDSATFDYDGTAKSAQNVTATGDGFVDGEGFEYTNFAELTQPGMIDNTFDYAGGNGTLVDDYAVTVAVGTLTVVGNVPSGIFYGKNWTNGEAVSLTWQGHEYSGTVGDGQFFNVYSGTSGNSAVEKAASTGKTIVVMSSGAINSAMGFAAQNVEFASENAVYKRMILGGELQAGSHEYTGSYTFSIASGTFCREVAAGDASNKYVDRTGDITFNISGGVFCGGVFGGSYYANQTSAIGSAGLSGDINFTISGGSFAGRVYGGCGSMTDKISSRAVMEGDVYLTIDASTNAITFGEHVVAGNRGNGILIGSTNVTVTGNGANLTFADSSVLFGGCSGDYYKVSNGTRTAVTSVVDPATWQESGVRALVFDAFTGDFNAEIRMFSDVSLENNTNVNFADESLDLKEVDNWNFDCTSCATNLTKNKFTGDTINVDTAGLASSWTLLSGDASAFADLGSASSVTFDGNAAVWSGSAWVCDDFVLRANGGALVVSKLA